HPPSTDQRTGAPLSRYCGQTALPGLEIVVNLQCQVDIAEDVTPPMVHDQCARTIRFDNLTHMRGEDEGAVGPLFEQLFVLPALEALVARCDDLINQIAIEIDCQRQRKREPGSHPDRIDFDWLR